MKPSQIAIAVAAVLAVIAVAVITGGGGDEGGGSGGGGSAQEAPEGSYTAKLLERGTGYIAQKVGEEAVEVVVAALEDTRLAEETADLLYHLLVLLEERGVDAGDVARILDERHR